MEKKKKPNIFLRILLLLFIVYISLTIAISTGYYEGKLNEKAVVTEEGMRQFEEDVKLGKDVDIKDYISDVKEDYASNTSKAGIKIAGGVEKFMTDGITKVIDVLKTLFTFVV